MFTSKLLTWVVIIGLFFSQSYAYASVPCESMNDLTSQHHAVMNSMDKNLVENDMSSHMQQQEMNMDCCDKECSCPGGTHSSAALSQSIIATGLSVVSEPSSFYLFSIPDAFLPSLHKPPIFS